MELKELILKYKENMISASNLTKELSLATKKEDWIKALEKRSEALASIYEEDNKILNRILEIIKEKEKTFTKDDEELKEIYFIVYQLYVDNYDDPLLMIPVLELLEKFYIENGNRIPLLVAYSIHAYEEHEYVTRANSATKLDLSIYKKILDFKKDYSSFKSQDVRYYIFMAFFNIVVGTDGLAGIDFEESYKYLLEMEEFYQSDEVKSIDGDNQYISDIVYDTRLTWLLVSENYDKLSDKLKDELFKRCKEFLEDNIEDSPKEAFMAYYRCLFGRNEITRDKLLDIYYNYILKEVNKLDNDLTDEDFVGIFELIIQALKVCDSKEMYLKLREIKINLENKITNLRLTPYINSLFANYVIEELKLDSDKERVEQDLFDNLIKRQASTYIHSVMVMHIALKIYEYMDKDLLSFIKNPKEYISNSALLHDIGKSKITDIVTQQRRKLSDNEFMGIKKHPSFGSSFLVGNKLLEEYYDIVIGHHKYYDGSGGYPIDFDNTKSKYKIVIDLITIADCIDAATDKFGRNYKKAKSILDVLAEFEASKGIKYSPYFVDLIKNNPKLIDELTYLAETKRQELMYEAYIKNKLFEEE